MMQYQPGQEVAIERKRGGYARGVVERLTKTQTIVKVVGWTSEQRYDKDGYEIGGGHTSWGRDKLKPMTPEIAAQIRKSDLVTDLRLQRWEDLPLVTLERVAAALD